MSLNFDFTEIEGYQELCWEETGELSEDGNPLFRVSGVTDVLVWATVGIDMGEITQKNYVEFATRLLMWQGVLGPMLQEPEEDENGKVTWVTRVVGIDDVRRHIGLSTNVRKTTRTQFMKSMERYMKDKEERHLEAVARKEEG
jgi:hypothetical protein